MASGFHWQFGLVLQYHRLLLLGFENAIELAAVSLVGGLLIGLPLGVARLSAWRAIRLPATAFVEVFRNTPALIQLFWFFYVVPLVTGWEHDVFLSSAMALACLTGAYSAEIFRGGIQSIARGQWEAGRAIGMRSHRVLRHVVLPQAMRRMIPAFTNRYIELVKETSLAGTLAYGELLYQGSLISSTILRPIETYTVVALIYVAFLSVLAALSGALERRLGRAG